MNEKLPNDMRERIARKVDNTVWSLDDMLNFLKREQEAKGLYQLAPRFLTNVNTLLTMKCFQVRLYLIKALIQT